MEMFFIYVGLGSFWFVCIAGFFVPLTWFCPSGPIVLMESMFFIADVTLL